MKTTRIIAEIAIVAALVIVFLIWNPFGWFRKPAESIQTATLAHEARAIGKLISAEYYGEALASIKDTLTDDQKDSLVIQWKAVQDSMTVGYARWKPKNAYQFERKIKKTNWESQLPYEAFIRYLYYIGFDPELKEPEVRFEKAERLALGKWLDDNGKIDERKMIVYYKQLHHQVASRKDKNTEIIYLGRGKVTAGLDLSNLDVSQMNVDSTQKTLILTDVSIEIFSTDINPIFMSNEMLNGFELVYAKGKAEDFERAKTVKQKCVADLKEQALRAGIMDKARSHAEETLSVWFQLLSDGRIENVKLE